MELAKKYNALTYLDEVHAVGLYGFSGGGVAQEQKIMGEIDIINGTLAFKSPALIFSEAPIKFIIGIVSLEAKLIEIIIARNKNKVTTNR